MSRITNLLETVRRNTRFTLLPLLLLIVLALYLNNARAATAPGYSAAASGTTDNLTLSITLNVADTDIAVVGKR